MSNIKKGIAVGLLAAVLLVSMVGMASAGTTWDLDSEAAIPGDNEMETTGTQSGSVAIGASGEKIWRADEAAECNVSFPASTWKVRIERTDNSGVQSFTAHVGYYDGSTWQWAGNTGEQTLLSATSALTRDIHASGFTVPKGKWLGLKVTSSSGITLATTGDRMASWLYWAPADPDYPYPELNTLALLGVGLLTLVGYVTYRRRNDKK